MLLARSLCRSRVSPSVLRHARAFSTFQPRLQQQQQPVKPTKPIGAVRENIYTLPNLLTVSRIVACPALGYAIVQGNYEVATGLLVYAGLTDLVCSPVHSVSYSC